MRRQTDSRKRRLRASAAGAHAGEQLEERRVMAFDLVSAYADSESPFYVSGQSTPTLTVAPQQLTLRFTPGVQIDTTTLANNISILRSGGKDDPFGATGTKGDVTVTPGIVLVDDAPNENQIVIRFQETLPDDSYQITVGAGLKTVGTLAEPAQTFRNGTEGKLEFRLELGAFVVSVVPQPVSRDGSGQLTQARDQIAVYFNQEDRLDDDSATKPASYRIFEVDPMTGADVNPTAPINPLSVAYSAATGKAVLTFAATGAGSLADDKLYRLQVGGAGALLPPAAAVAETAANHSSFLGAQNLGELTAAGATVSGAIAVKPTLPTPSGSLEFAAQPGTVDEPGHREIPSEPTADSGHHGVGWSTGPAQAVVVQQYNFKDVYGQDPYGNDLHNAITETQKQRAREVFELFSRYTGIRFVETASEGLTVVTGDVRANGYTVPPTAVGGIAGGGKAIINGSLDWGPSEYGGSWFQVAMHEIGHALGLAHSYDLPSIMGKGLTGEKVFPGDYDTVHLAQLYPATGNDVDVYSFTLSADGAITAQTFVARPGQPVLSTLDSVLTLYRQDPATGRRELIARNDDYYGRDSFIGLELSAKNAGGGTYTYYLAVTSTGNTAFDPAISDSGYGGRSDGDYKLQLDFKPASTTATTIIDAKGSQIDGDRDGRQGGAFAFWFKTASPAATVFVDKATTIAVAQQDGSLAKPYSSIKAALAAVNAAKADADPTNDKSIVRIIGNDAKLPYLIGTKPGTSQPLDATEGTTFNVPKDVTVMIDAGAVFKLRSAVIDVGSSSPLVSRAGASLQVLGTPGVNNEVVFTSYHDDSIGGNSDGVGPAAVGGQWGGIVFREDSDFAKKTAFVNAVSQARIVYGGGNVTVDSQLAAFAPIQLESSRPTLAFNTITNSAGAAIAADPNSFEDSNGRIGPEIRGNKLLQNTINGLFLNIRTSLGQPVDKLDVPARLKSGDIVYVVPENLFINGGAGGYEQKVDPVDGLTKMFARQSGRLAIDPGVVVKLQGARIELERGVSQLIAEGTAGKPVIFTSLADNRFGAGGTFDTNGNQPNVYSAGDWGGVVLDAGSRASLDHAYVAFGGGQTPIEGGFDSFGAIEVHQGDLRLAHSRIENNAAGTASTNRDGRGGNAAATVFVRGAQPVIVGNDFRNNVGAVVSINANSLTDVERPDPGRSTGGIDRDSRYDANVGPLVRDNVLPYAGSFQGGATVIAGMQVRGEEITVQSVWDDVDIVHVLQNEIIVQNFHTATGIRLVSQTNASLVVKLAGTNAGFTAAGYGLDIQDRIGGTVQVVGQPGYPVVLTSLKDDSIGAGLDPLGRLVKDTNQDSLAAVPTTPTAGDWRSLKFLPLSNDRNVAILQERESPATGGVDTNSSIDAAESLGVLAPNFATGSNTTESAQEKSGDDSRRLGFEAHGRIATDMPSDVDMYSFAGYAGSEVWIDVDKTSPSLDAMVELLDAAGNVLARSMDSGLEGGLQQDGGLVGLVDALNPARFTYQLSRTVIRPESLSGYVQATFNGNVVLQQYHADAAGNVTFDNVAGSIFESNRAIGASIDWNTGVLTVDFSLAPDAAPLAYAEYTYQTAGAFSATTLGIGRPLTKESYRGGDYWSVNPKDPGMRVILPSAPGQGNGALTQYYIRVRSQPRYDAVGENGATPTSQAAYEASLQADPSTAPGATSGRYTVSVRLGQRDEVPGSTVRYADIRYPDIGIDAQGLPHNSPLTGENGENATDANGAFASAQYVGNLLQADRNTISIAGSISSSTDVDWYTFALNYEQIQAIAGVNGGQKSWATVFDLDYGDGFRGDLTISVFDSTGKLIYTGRDSNVKSDQPGAGQGSDFDDLSRGSAGKLDPYIGSIMMPAGTPTGSGSVESGGAAIPPDPTKQLRYYVAVSSNERLPSALDATFRSVATNSLIRLEPVNSVQRVVEDHIGTTGYTDAAGSRQAPMGTAMIDTTTATSLSTNVRSFTLADVTLFVSDNATIATADAKTGGRETVLNVGAGYTNSGLYVGDMDMRPDGRLYAYAWVFNDKTTAGRLLEINTGDGTIAASSNDAIADKASSGATNIQTNSSAVQAVAFRRTNVGDYNDLWLVIQDSDFGGSKLYKAADGGTAAAGGASATASQAYNDANALGYRGNIVLAGNPINVTGIQFAQDTGSTLYGVTADGKFVSIAPAGKPGSDTAPNTLAQATLICDCTAELAALGGGTTGFTALAAAPQNLYDGLFRGQFFALTNTGRLVLLNPNGPTAQRAAGDLTNGTTTVANLASAASNLANLNGMVVFGNGIDSNTTVTNVNVGAATLTLSRPAKATVAGATLVGVRPAATHGGSTTFGSTTVGNLGVNDLDVGMLVIGAGIPDGTVITAIDRGTNSFTLSQAATATSFSTPLRFLSAAVMPTELAVERNGSGDSTTPVVTIDTTGLQVGMEVSGRGIADGTTIVSIDPASRTITLSQSPLGSGTSYLKFYDHHATRAGLADGTTTVTQFQLVDDLRRGMLVFGAGVPAGTVITAINRASKAITLSQPLAAGTVDLAFVNTTSLGYVADWASDTNASPSMGSGLTGLAFSPLDVNLWHVTENRTSDDGHGIDQAPDASRTPELFWADPSIDVDRFGNSQSRRITEAEGGASMWFGLEQYTPTPTSSQKYWVYNSTGNDAGQFGVEAGGSYDWQQELTANPAIGNNYNLPGGAYGSTITNPFSLAGSETTDKPTLYFNYFLDAQKASGGLGSAAMRDSARVFISSDDGLTWELIATNNTVRSPIDEQYEELPAFASVSSRMSYNGNQQVQQLYDVAGWRQARVDLGNYAGLDNLRLRFDFSTAGEFDSSQRDAYGNLINSIDGPAAVTGDFSSTSESRQRGQNNDHEGFYFDDIIVGFAERGEMVTGAAAGQTGFFDVGTPFATPTVPAQNLQGSYQLEIRRGTQYGAIVDPLKGLLGLGNPLPTNADLVAANRQLGDSNPIRQQGQFIVESNVISNAKTYGISIDAGDPTLQRDAGTNAPNQGVVRNLPVLNNGRLVPGAVVINNVIASSGTAGILFSGDPNTGNVPAAAVPYGRVVNNTITGGVVINLAASITATSTSVTLSTTANLKVGMLVSGSGIASGTTIAGIVDGQKLLLSKAATATSATAALRFRDPATQGTGVMVTQNAGPTLLNNLFANLGTGVSVDLSSQFDGAGNQRTVIGTSAYYSADGSMVQVSGATQSQPVVLTSNPFVSESTGNYYLAAGSQAIDSSLNSLGDRSELVVVTSPLGIPQSPILAPNRDLFGQLRGDDPNQASVSGLGSNVFKDRGAIDRVDFTQPTARFLVPQDGATTDKDPSDDSIRLVKADAQGITRFVLQLNDSGVGIDKATVVKDAFTVTRDGLPLVAGTDYVFQYLENSNQVVFESDSVYPGGRYVITVTSRQSTATVPGLLTDLANNQLLPNKADGSTVFVVELADVPGIPAIGSVVAGDAKATLNWAAPLANGSPITDYAVEFSADGGANWTRFNHPASTATAIVVTGLTNRTAYVFRVAAVNAVGESLFSAVTVPVTPYAVPTAPLSLVGTSGDGQVSLIWNAPASDGGSPILDYVVQFGTDGTTWTTFVDGVEATTGATVTGLANGTSYFFRVAARTQYGDGVAAVTAAVKPIGLPSISGVPQAVGGDRKVTLSWQPAFLNGGTILNYLVQYRASTDVSWTDVVRSPSDMTAVEILGFINGSSYTFRVAAVNEAGAGGWSQVSNAVTPARPASAPTGLEVTAGDGSVGLVWTTPADDGGQAITGYRVEYRLSTGSAWTTVNVGAVNSYTLRGLTNGSAYVFRVAAVTSVGAGDVSAMSAAVTPHMQLLAPTSVVAVRGNGSATVSWRAPSSNGGSALVGYDVQISSDGGATFSLVRRVSATTTALVVTGLSNETAYQFRVAAVNGYGPGNWSNAVAATGPASAPTLTSSVGNGNVVLNWSTPTDDGGRSLTGYRIEYKTSTATTWTPLSVGLVNTRTVTGLINGTSYVFRVAGVTSYGTGMFSAQTASLKPIGPAAAPGSFTQTAGTGSVKLAWTPPTVTGGSSITTYVVQYRASNSATWQTFVPVSPLTSGSRSTTVTGLTKGTGYVFRVAAVTAFGNGTFVTSGTVKAL